MEAEREITQSRFGVKTRFVFAEDRLTFTLRDTTGERSFGVPYEVLALQNTGHLTFNNNVYGWRLRLLPVVGVLAGIGLAAAYNETLGDVIMSACAAAFVLLLILSFFHAFAVRFTLVPLVPAPPEASGHPLRIIEDKDGGRILGELERRWKTTMKQLYGAADPLAEPGQELARLSWLKENAILTSEEYEEQKARLPSPSDDPSSPATQKLLN